MFYSSKNCVKKNEITFLPYVNQDYNAKHNRIDWVDPRAQRGGAVLGEFYDFIHHSLWSIDHPGVLDNINAYLRPCTGIFHRRGLEKRLEAFARRNS